MINRSTSTHPHLSSEYPLAAEDWTPDALAKRVFILTVIALLCVGTAFVWVGLVGPNF